MSGKSTHIRTNESCSVCGKAFSFDEKIGFYCLPCKQFPRRYRIDVSWKGKREKIYSNKQGQILEGYLQALDLQSLIVEEIVLGTFDPSNYRREDQKKFWVVNLIEEFLSQKIDSIAPSNKKDYRRYSRVAADFFKTTDARQIRKIDLINYQRSLEGIGIGRKTIKNYLDHFKTFLRWCKEVVEVIAIVPSFPKVDFQTRPIKWLSKSDQIKIFGNAPEQDQHFFNFLALHGIRPGEARAIRCKDVNLGLRTITISATFSGNVYREQRKGRGAQGFTIPIHSESFEYITKRVQSGHPEAYVFINPRTGGPYTENALRRLRVKIWDEAGISPELRLYDATRHSFASQQREAGTDIAEIKEHLGHSDIRTTLKYAHPTLAKLRANLEKLSMKKVLPLPREGEFVRGLSVGSKKKKNY